MVEYIKRNAAIDACFNGWNNNAHDCAENIRKLPAADVLAVVLCKDCKMQQYCKVAQYLGKDGFCSNGEKDVRSLGKCKLYKDCEYRTIWNCCCEDCNMMEES